MAGPERQLSLLSIDDGKAIPTISKASTVEVQSSARYGGLGLMDCPREIRDQIYGKTFCEYQ